MKPVTKIFLIAAALLVLAGALLFTAVLAKNDWSLESLGGADYETHSYPIPGDFRSISIHSDTENIAFLPSDDGSCRVEITEKQKETCRVAVEDGTLHIEEPEQEKWAFSLSFSLAERKITVYLPKTEYADLFIEESTGDVEIPGDFRFERISVHASTGDVDCRASASASIWVTASTGDIRLSDLSAGAVGVKVSTGRVELRDLSCTGELSVEVTTGRAELTNISCGSLVSTGSTGDLTMKKLIAAQTLTVERSTGDVRFEACDAAELEIATSTGDVKGSLLSEKVFITQSDTGRVRVPESITGGKCKVTTNTGDIEIDVEKKP